MKKIILILSIFAIAVSFDSCKKTSSPAPDPAPVVNTPADTSGNGDTTAVVTSTVTLDIILAVPMTTNTLLSNYDTSNVKVFLKSPLSLSLTPIPISITSTTSNFRNDRFGGTCLMASNDSVIIIFNTLLYRTGNELSCIVKLNNNPRNVYNNINTTTYIGNYSMSNAPTFGGGLVSWCTGSYRRVANKY